MTTHDRYSSPLAERYASKAMLELWSPQTRHGLWRRLWLALAESERQLGVPIPDEAIAQMRAHLDDIDFDAVAVYEKRFRHDVMAHVHAFGDVAPAARPFIHLGATSAFVTDNGDLMLMRSGLELLREKVVRVLRALAAFAVELAVEDLFPWAEVEPAGGDGDDDLAAHDGALEVRVGVVLAAVVPVLIVGLLRREFFQPDLEVVMQAGFVVVDEDGGSDVHGVDQAEAFPHAAFAQRGVDLRGDVHELPALGQFEPEFFAEGFHGGE